MAKIILLNGSSNLEGCTYTALREIADTLEKEGLDGNLPVGERAGPRLHRMRGMCKAWKMRF